MSDFIGPFIPSNDGKEEVENDQREIGPVLPPCLSNTDNNSDEVIGPVIPPHLANNLLTNSDEPDSLPYITHASHGDEEEEFGPSLPPGFEQASNSNERVLGPQLPPGFKQQESTESDNEEIIIGPLPPSNSVTDDRNNIAQEFERRSRKMKDRLEGKEEPKKIEREEWMTELPPVLQGKIGLGPRQFRARPTEVGDRSGWTDTPSDKARKSKEDPEKREVKPDTSMLHIMQRDSNIAQQLSEYTKGSDSTQESLVSMHEKKRKRKLQEDEANGVVNARRPFDRDVDLQANRFDDATKKRMLKQSAGLSSRFSHGETSGTFL